MSFDWNWLSMEIVNNSIGVFASEALGIQDKLISPNDNQLIRYVKMGVVWELIDEAILLFKHGTSHLVEGNYYIVVDDVFFNSATWGLLEQTGVGSRVNDSLENKLPFSNDINSAIATGVIKVSAKVFKAMIEKSWSETPLGYLTSVTKMSGIQASKQGSVVSALF